MARPPHVSHQNRSPERAGQSRIPSSCDLEHSPSLRRRLHASVQWIGPRARRFVRLEVAASAVDEKRVPCGALHRPARNDPRQGPFHGLFRRPSAMNEAAMKAGARRSILCWRVGHLDSKKLVHVTGQALSEHGDTATDHAGLRRWPRSDDGSGRGRKPPSQVAGGRPAPPASYEGHNWGSGCDALRSAAHSGGYRAEVGR